jgi:hypothetical protein
MFIKHQCSLIKQPIMRPLSSKMTFYYKRVSPVIFFGVVLLMFGFGLIPVLRDRQVSNVPFLIVLLLLAVFAYLLAASCRSRNPSRTDY